MTSDDYLTQNEMKAFQKIEQYISDHGCSPTATELAQAIGIRSRGVAYRYIKSLEQKGYIRLQPHRHRNISLLKPLQDVYPPVQLSQLPIKGYIAAGKPIEAVIQQEYCDVSPSLYTEDRYILKVRGDSMKNEGILDGDYIVCQHTCSARPGQIVVALIDQCEVTLKKYQPVDSEYTDLVAANESMQAMRYHSKRVTIQGIYIALLRLHNMAE